MSKPAPAPLGALQSAVVSGVDSTLVTVEVHREDGLHQYLWARGTR